ncbi:TolC family protein [Caenimonas terrae]|uniref:TolC family protein n=1 Tax=Caenimonas terrae TaxID=696074 RepID=A0ABW0NCH9_9BURK
MRTTLLEAVRSTLENNVNVKVQERQVQFAQGALEGASGQFDPALGSSIDLSRARTPLTAAQQAQGPLTTLDSDVATYSMQLSQQLRNGAVIGASVSGTRSLDNVSRLSGVPAQNLGRIDLSLLLPLGKGSGSAASAVEAASSKELEATRADLTHSLAQNVLTTITAYWGLVAARQNLEIARQGETGVGRLRQELQKLVAADERPAADLTLLSANVADKVAQRLSAERVVLDAQQALGRSMGLPYSRYSALEPVDGFPNRPRDLSLLPSETSRLTEYALRRRPDVVAADLRRAASQTLADAARQNLKPQIDLKLHVGYAGLHEGNTVAAAWPFGGQVAGPSGGATLIYQWSFGNRSAQGALVQQLALVEQSDLRIADLRNAVGAGVETALAGASSSARQLLQSVDSLALYRRAVENEKMKNRLGQSTLIEVLSVNDLLLAALAADIAYQANYLTSVARLRFETATLLEPSGNGQTIRLDQLLSVPTVPKE